VSADPLRVALGERGYDIHIGPGEIDRAGERLAGRIGAAFVVTDEHLARSGHLERLEASLRLAGIRAPSIVLPPGETSKSFAVLERLLDELIAAGADRGATVVALGGGVIGDLAGFAAAVLLRGVAHVQVPTTLLAQVDSAVGGKTGINSRLGKNLIGAFHQPRMVLIDTGVLDTLPARELRAGYAEVVKYGLIDDPGFFDWLEANGARLLAGETDARAFAVRRSLEAKARIVTEDERETSGRRALLNLGHTFAHAFEALAGYDGRLLHGEAVALGLVKAFALSARQGLCPPEDVERVRAHLAAAGLPVRLEEIHPGGFAVEEVIAAMARDKKAESGRVRFVLVRGIGRAFAGAGADPEALRAVLAEDA
jgi:3-dehydroquinate synthase